MKDNYGDPILVTHDGEDVSLDVHDNFLGEEPAIATLTPAKARKLAKKLRRAADEIDGGQAAPTDALRARDGFQLSGYLLDLTQAEAETLAVILYRVGGQPDSTPRGYADAVRAKLSSLGLDAEVLNRRPQFAMETHAASLYFENRA